MKNIIIYGSGGFGRELAWIIEQRCLKKVSCFVDDNNNGKINNIEVISPSLGIKKYPKSNFIVSIGNPKIRKILTIKMLEYGLFPETIISPDVLYSSFVSFGEGNVICPGTIITCNIKIGNYNQINLGCTIGHDVIIKDFVTLSPGVHISGNVVIESGVFIGTGAVIINGTKDKPIKIGKNCIIGAGSCVTKDIISEKTVYGVPAKYKT